ncbi:hypothetical protein [Sphingobacterium multivorum]|uniref:hypothetical protein n=1 Tax=Sphingobacterium multivorum TaxID=28454 RepID=UPI0028A988E2|nr:hypothetical protein [Sphingobacterium multivorum]
MKFKPISEMRDLKEFLEHFLPKDHNQQDIIFLTYRYEWETVGTRGKSSHFNTREEAEKSTEESRRARDLAWDNMVMARVGTTFDIKNNPEKYRGQTQLF